MRASRAEPHFGISFVIDFFICVQCPTHERDLYFVYIYIVPNPAVRVIMTIRIILVFISIIDAGI